MRTHTEKLILLAATAALTTGCTSAIEQYLKDARTDESVASQSEPPTCLEASAGLSAIEAELDSVEPGADAGTIRIAAFYTGACLRGAEIESDGTMEATYLAEVEINEDLLDLMVRSYDEEPNADYRSRMESAMFGLDHAFKFALYGAILENEGVYPAPNAPQGTMGGVEGATPEQLATVQANWCTYAGGPEYKRFMSGKIPEGGNVYLERTEALSGLLAHGCTDRVEAALSQWLREYDVPAGAAEQKGRANGDESMAWKSAGTNKFQEALIADKGYPSANDIGQFINRAAKYNTAAAKAQTTLLTERVTSCAASKELLGGLLLETEASIQGEVSKFQARYKKMCGE